MNKYEVFKAKVVTILPYFYLGSIVISSFWTQVNINRQLPLDFPIYLIAGQRALNNQNVYEQFEIGSSFVYPPTALLVFTSLPYVYNPREIHIAISIICMVLALFIMQKIMPHTVSRKSMFLFGMGAIVYAPFLEQVTIGQINSWVLLGIAIFALGISNPRYRYFGDFGLAAAIVFKITPIMLFAFPLISGDWKRCLRILAYLMILMIVSIIIFGIPVWIDFFQVLPAILKGYPGMNNQTFGTLIKWSASQFDMTTVPEWIGLLFSSLVLTAWIVVLVISKNNNNPMAILSFGILGMTISSSLIWYHHYVFLMIPIGYLLLTANIKSVVGKLVLFLTLTGTILINTNRIFEFLLSIPPLIAIIGYLAIYVASVLGLRADALKTDEQTPSSVDVRSEFQRV